MAFLPCLRAVSMQLRMSRRSWVTSSLARRPEIFCWAAPGGTGGLPRLGYPPRVRRL
jgi:hypothetical protein